MIFDMIDILICAYNAHKYIEETLNSLEKQTIKEQLLITIIDDGSKKDYKSIIEKYNNRLKINLIRLRKNHGLGYARQKSISLTKNDYFFIIDADDILIDNRALEKLYTKALENPSYKIIIGKEKHNNKIFYHKTHTQNKLYKREIINKYNIKVPKVRMEEDSSFSLSLLLMLKESEIGYIKDPTYEYRKVNSSALTNIYSIENGYTYEPYFKSINYAYKYAKKYHKYNEFQKLLYEILEGLNNLYYKQYHHSNIELHEKFLKNCHKFYLKYKEYYNKIEIKGKKEYEEEDFYKILSFLNIIKDYER